MALTRRQALRRLAGAAALTTMGAPLVLPARQRPPLKGRIRHSVCKWCYPNLSVEALAAAGVKMGLQSIELLDPPDWPRLRPYGLICAMGNGPSRITEGFNRLENHAWLVPQFKKRIEEAAEAGVPNLICFSGNRNGMDDEEGLENCVIGLKQILPTAEKYGVTICMELLNSKIDHPDYMCDRTEWGVRLVQRLGSERFKLLYDIYHMQIMEGDIIRTIQNSIEYIAHFHTAGVPGRHEIDDSQELYYPAIMRAIAATGFDGFVAQEFIPTADDPLESLRHAIAICDV
ncbi:hydroxypyruvate isomerase family protein [Rhodothermus profundi]|uniref:Hydroxypyruvate isomerase n=1 Tax=Rhodothermus profundi TaxID=633813 RepID=A0A1M6VIA5_9BACT|nr:TIM barrel protein [Rhodothermus profundi]SHK80986.1 hydroxypyruvate isomerase [Rhodothermus profundi]